MSHAPNGHPEGVPVSVPRSPFPVPRLGHAPAVARRRFVRLAEGRALPDEAVVAEEVPVAFVYGRRAHVVMMCTPADLEDLAVGFSVTEEIVAGAREVGEVRVARHGRGIELAIEIPADAAARLEGRTRALPARTGCGLCGVEAIDDAVRAPRAVRADWTLRPDALWRAARALDAAQVLNAETHAIHAAAWCDVEGNARVVREDVGRHNALDKVIGGVLRAGLDPSSGWLLVTSRASFELVQKAAVAGVPLLAAVSRPTGLAIELAERSGMTLVGLVRGETGNVYAGKERLGNGESGDGGTGSGSGE